MRTMASFFNRLGCSKCDGRSFPAIAFLGGPIQSVLGSSRRKAEGRMMGWHNRHTVRYMITACLCPV